ncbi:hypothetical protein MMC27_006721 [Xylographa pallens]|nr:hypothetical protein [Xylographa pallens]
MKSHSLIAETSIVAVHGLNGGRRKSWTDPVTATFWLQDLLPEIVPHTRILSFGYDASKTSTTDLGHVAYSLIIKLVFLRESTKSEGRPIVWLAHSLGGQLLKGLAEAIAESYRLGRLHAYGGVKLCTYGILFFGVPKPGEDGFSNLAAVNTQEIAAIPDSPQTKVLKRELAWLKRSNEVYSTICEEYVTRYFVESSMEVSNESNRSTPIPNDLEYTNLESIPLGKTHGRMIQFPDATDRDYQTVSTCLDIMVAQATKKGRNYTLEAPVTLSFASYLKTGRRMIGPTAQLFSPAQLHTTLTLVSLSLLQTLLEFRIHGGWVPLCKFLRKEVLDLPFPHADVGKDVQDYYVREDGDNQYEVGGKADNPDWHYTRRDGG